MKGSRKQQKPAVSRRSRWAPAHHVQRDKIKTRRHLLHSGCTLPSQTVWLVPTVILCVPWCSNTFPLPQQKASGNRANPRSPSNDRDTKLLAVLYHSQAFWEVKGCECRGSGWVSGISRPNARAQLRSSGKEPISIFGVKNRNSQVNFSSVRPPIGCSRGTVSTLSTRRSCDTKALARILQPKENTQFLWQKTILALCPHDWTAAAEWLKCQTQQPVPRSPCSKRNKHVGGFSESA